MTDHDPHEGIWVMASSGMWHRSVTFNGYDHGLACDAVLAAGDSVIDVQQDTTTRPKDVDDGTFICSACRLYWSSHDQTQEQGADTHPEADPDPDPG